MYGPFSLLSFYHMEDVETVKKHENESHGPSTFFKISLQSIFVNIRVWSFTVSSYDLK